jgi:hypothetical protein
MAPLPPIGIDVSVGAGVSVGRMGTSVTGSRLGTLVGNEVDFNRVGATGEFTTCSVRPLVELAVVQAEINNSNVNNEITRLQMLVILLSS